jgi:hypothetical protein
MLKIWLKSDEFEGIKNPPFLLPILNPADNVIAKFLRHAHISQYLHYSENVIPLHASETLTAQKMLTGPFAIFVPRLKQLIASFILGCAPCNRQRCTVIPHPLGTRLTKVVDMAQPLTELSVDPFGPVTIRLFKSSRATRGVYILAIRCLFTGFVNLVALDSMQSSDIAAALTNVEYRFGVKIKKIYADNAINLSHSSMSKYDVNIFYESLNNLYSSNIINVQFMPNLPCEKMTFLSNLPFSQFRNYSKKILLK